MSAPNIQAWFNQFYTSDVNLALQSEGFLTKGMTTDTDEVVGNQVFWNTITAADATEHPLGISQVGLMGVQTDRVSATILDFDADAEFKTRDTNKISANLQAALTESGKRAIGRQYDNFVLDAITQEAGVEVIGAAGGGDTITLAMTQTAVANIAGAQLSMAENFCAVPPIVMMRFLNIQSFASSDYVGDSPFMKKIGARTWLGTTYFPMENSFFTSRAPVANNIDLFVWNKRCVGRVTQELTGARLDWLPREKAWHIGQSISGCARVILPGGVKRVRGLMPTTV